uniref:FYN binding protein n=1 Tax=Iconisemion striatum TaxID=60296 RepID=A0A1A7WYZ3_9TELE
MDTKADVKAMRARFQAGGVSTEDSSSTPVGHPKQSVQPTLSGPTNQRKPVSGTLSSSLPPKPSPLKATLSSKSDTDATEPNKIKAMANRFGHSQDESMIPNKAAITNKLQSTLKPAFPQTPEAKGFAQKSPLNKPSSENKPAFPKPPGVPTSKPSWVKEDTDGVTVSNTTSTPPKIPNLQQKPISNVRKMWQQSEDQGDANTETVNKPPPQITVASKPASNFKSAQNMFNKEKDTSESTESSVVSKRTFAASSTFPPPAPPASKKPSIKKPTKFPPQANGTNGEAGPKRNPLPNSLALGPAPAKPNRPPKVELENFKRGAEASENGPGLKKPTAPTLPAAHPIIQIPAQSLPPALPNLPPRHPGNIIQEDVYDDVDSAVPPPLPSAHPSQKPFKNESGSDDEEMYEDLEERWEEADRQDKKKEDKEEKKRQEAAKKEQKERERKEQDAKKKFKLVGPLVVIQKGKSLSDCRGGKMDLTMKQGEHLDIIRVQGNPEGKWLARSQDGSFGYVKATSVEIDFNSLKNHSASSSSYDPEVYDDIDVVLSESSGIKGPGVVLPPLPDEGGEIYDDVVDPNMEVSSLDLGFSLVRPNSFLRMFDRKTRSASSKVVPPPSQFTADGSSEKHGAAIDEDIYDDVDAQIAPPLPPLTSLPGMKGRNKTEDIDPKKQKKFEKEEKDFRKKFKYEGEIKVLNQVSIIPTLNQKKFCAKDLPVKAGEKLDVIVKVQDDKWICRNEDGKLGYVSTSHIVNADDGEIYDDIGVDDCIYDND